MHCIVGNCLLNTVIVHSIVGVHALNDWKNIFFRITDIKIENFTKHPHLYKQPTSRSVKSLKRKMEKLHFDSLTKSNIKIDKIDLPTFHWLPKLHKNPYKSRLISNSSHCSTTIRSKHIISALTAVKDHAVKYSETAFSNSNVNYFWSIKKSVEVIEKLRLRNFQGSQVCSFDFSTLYTSLPHALIKEKALSLFKWCFNRESKTYLCTSDKAGFFSKKTYGNSIPKAGTISHVSYWHDGWRL